MTRNLSRNQQIAAIAGAILAAFLIGFLWQYLRAQAADAELRSTRAELEFVRMETLLANAALAAFAGNHEVGRQWASDFFTRLQGRVGAIRGEARAELDEVLAHRDAAITALSRADPRAGELLYTLHDRFRQALGRPPLSLPVLAPGPAERDPDFDDAELEEDTLPGAAP
jgi:hypothetical protein